MHPYELHEIVQVRPDFDTFGGCFVVVTKVKSTGIQGYVQGAGVSGQSYILLKHEDIAKTGGKAVWIVE